MLLIKKNFSIFKRNYATLKKRWGWKYEYIKFLVLLLIPLSIVFVTSQPISQKSKKKKVQESFLEETPQERMEMRGSNRYFSTLEEKNKVVEKYLEVQKNLPQQKKE